MLVPLACSSIEDRPIHRSSSPLHAMYAAQAALEKAAKLARKGLPDRNLEVPRALERLAGCYRRKGDHDGAVEGYQAGARLEF